MINLKDRGGVLSGVPGGVNIRKNGNTVERCVRPSMRIYFFDMEEIFVSGSTTITNTKGPLRSMYTLCVLSSWPKNAAYPGSVINAGR